MRSVLLRVELFCCLSALIFCGCVSSKNVSDLEPFSEYVGKTASLRRPMILVKESRGFWSASSIPRVHVSPYVMSDPGASEKKGASIELPVGQSVRITKVCYEMVGDSSNIIAYGTVMPPGSANRQTFAYRWGGYWELRPAPWEPNDAPPIRRRAGKLPPHWEYYASHPPTNAPTWGEPDVHK
jgi:hypothetical protein